MHFFIFKFPSNYFALSFEQQNPNNEVMALSGSHGPGKSQTSPLESGNLFSGNLFPELEFKNCANLVALNLSNSSLYGTGIARSLTKLEREIPFEESEAPEFISEHPFWQWQYPPEVGSTCGTLVELDLSGNGLSLRHSTHAMAKPWKQSAIRKFPHQPLSSQFHSTTLLEQYLQISGTVRWGNNFSALVKSQGHGELGTWSSLLSSIMASVGTFLHRYSITNRATLSWLSLSFNQLTITTPADLRNLQKPSILQLSYNSFSGNIQAADLGSFKNIIWLDLGNKLPGTLELITFLANLDVSNNNLTGPIPSTGQLTTFPSSRYENNLGLKWDTITPCDHHHETIPISSDVNGKGHSIFY
ncbi:hypothetical protein V6N13_066901 [Hibiscus sabdariffa]